MSDEANIEINGTTYYFRDFATNDTTTEFNTLIKNADSGATTCYVAEKGQADCTDSPDQPDCYVDTGPI